MFEVGKVVHILCALGYVALAIGYVIKVVNEFLG